MNRTEHKENKIGEIVKMYEHSSEHLAIMINEKKAKIINNNRTEFERKLIECDLEILEKALREIKRLLFQKLIIKIIPIVISLYFIIFEISHLKQDILNVGNFYSFAIILIKVFIIFLVFPIAYLEKITNYFLRLESKLFPADFFYKIMYWAIGVLLIIKLFEI